MDKSTTCLSVDALITLGNAFGWQFPKGLQHLDRCQTCRETMERLALARQILVEADAAAATQTRAVERRRRASGSIIAAPAPFPAS